MSKAVKIINIKTTMNSETAFIQSLNDYNSQLSGYGNYLIRFDYEAWGNAVANGLMSKVSHDYGACVVISVYCTGGARTAKLVAGTWAWG